MPALDTAKRKFSVAHRGDKEEMKLQEMDYDNGLNNIYNQFNLFDL